MALMQITDFELNSIRLFGSLGVQTLEKTGKEL